MNEAVTAQARTGDTRQPAETMAKRDTFTSRLGVIAATLGSAIGLGNIWKFPYLTGVNGGAAFVALYVVVTFLVGLPVMIAEHAIGRAGRGDAVKSLRKLSPSRPWWLVGLAGILSAFLILAFYSEIAGWVLAYVFKGLSGTLLSTDPHVTTRAFEELVTNPWQALAWQWVVFAYLSFIILAGVSRGIERATKRLLPALFVILILVCIRSLTLPGASRGVEFLFRPDFSKVTWATVLAATGLSFFKLSVGMGTMITYGSYFPDDQNIPATATRVMFSDLLVSILAGLAVFPTVFAFGFQPNAGPSLLFITMPAVFASMPLGRVFMPLFFILAGIAATGAMLSLFEVPVAFLTETCGWDRRKATVATLAGLVIFGSTAALSFSALANVKVGGFTAFDLYDFLTSWILMPLGGMFLCLFLGWVWGRDNVRRVLSNDGELDNRAVVDAFYLVAKFVAPFLVFAVMLNGLGIIKF